MPLFGTRGALSSRGFGLLAGIDGPYWAATLGDAGEQYGRAVAVDPSGNVYATGYAFISGPGNEVLLTKYNTSGVIQWQRLLSGTNTDLGLAIAVDSSGNSYITGYTYTGASTYDILIAKYDTNGTIQWQQKLGGSGQQRGNGIFVDASNNVYVTGFQLTGGNAYLIVAKYNSSGVLQWQKGIYDSLTIGDNSGNSVVVTPSGEICVVGWSNVSGTYEIQLVKLNASTTIQWQRSLGRSQADGSEGIALDSLSNIYVVGETRDPSTFQYSLVLAKYDSSGVIQWQRTLTAVTYDLKGWSVAIDAADRIYVTARSHPNGIPIACYNNSGTLIWQRNFTGFGTDEDAKIAVTPLGVMSLAATTYSAGAGQSEMLLIRLPGNGTRTGTYGPWFYEPSAFTSATSSLTDAATTLTISNLGMTDAAAGLTGSTPTYTSTVTSI